MADVAAREKDVNELQQQVSAQSDQLGELTSDKKQAQKDIETRDKDVNELQQRVSALLDQLGKFRSEEGRVQESIEARDKDVVELRQQFETLTQDNEKLTRIAAGDANEIDRLKKAVSGGKTAMADAKKTLQKSERAAKSASKKAIADLKLANKRVAEADALEVSNAALAEEMVEKTNQVSSLDQSLGDIKKRLRESESESKSLRASEAALKKLEKSLSDKDARIDALQAELATQIKEDTSTQALLDKQLNALPSSSATQETAPRGFGAAIVAFEVVRDGKVEQILKVEDCPTRIMVGRGEDSDICLDSHFVSRHHALIFHAGKEVHIEDLNSSNGTMVNLKTIARCELRPGDKVTVGDYQIRPR